MKKFTSVSSLLLFLICCISSAYGQGVTGAPGHRTQPETPSPVIGTGRVEFTSPQPEERVIKEGILAPSSFDISEHEYLLSLPNTGLIRLMPRESYDWEVYDVERKIEMRGGGAFFSFHLRRHPYPSSDIKLERGQLSVGFAGADYGMMTDLGVTSLEQININDPRTRYLTNYEPPVDEPDARREAVKFNRDVVVDGATYRSGLPTRVSHTYLLRSISHGTSDVLVAFRIARQDEDGSLIIAWKLLKEFPTPKLSTIVVRTVKTTR